MDLKLSKQGGYRSPHFREYVLPDGVNNFRGYIRVSARKLKSPRRPPFLSFYTPPVHTVSLFTLPVQEQPVPGAQRPPPQSVAAARQQVRDLLQNIVSRLGNPAVPSPSSMHAGGYARKRGDLTRAHNPLPQDLVIILPLTLNDDSLSMPMVFRKEQVLLLNNERFMVPEAMFRPQDIGLQQAGVAEAVVQAVTAAHPALQPLLYTNIVLTGMFLEWGTCQVQLD